MSWLSAQQLSNQQLMLNLKANIEQMKFASGLTTLESNDRFKIGNHRLVYYMEKGALLHYQGKFTESNEWFDKADFYIEDYKKKTGEVVLTYLSNPNSADYPGEDFEALFINYYKALNYISLNQLDEALVEAKRMNILLNWFNDKYPDNKYDKDAFIHLVMGLIYDANKEYNDACIAYKNAYKIYENDYMVDYGLGRPDQLIEDIVRTARLAGLTQDYEQYKSMMYVDEVSNLREKGSVVVLWHNGMSPKKVAENVEFRVSNVGGYVTFSDHSNNENYKFAAATIGSLGTINSIINNQSGVYKMAFSRYEARKPIYTNATLKIEGSEFPKSLELCEDLNAIAYQSHLDRKARQFADALARLVIREAGKTIAKQAAGQAAGAAISQIPMGGGLLGSLAKTAATIAVKAASDAAIDAAMNSLEKADLRQWSSLPHSIYYSRVFFNEGTHSIQFKAEGDQLYKEDIVVDIRHGESQFSVIRTMEHSGFETIDRNSPDFARLEAERKERDRIFKAKTMYFRTLPKGSWPTGSSGLRVNAVYFIAMYSAGDQVYFSNVIKVNGYSGGSWPFRNDVLKEIEQSSNSKFKLFGFYESQQEAKMEKDRLTEKGRGAQLTVSEYNVKQEFGFASSGSGGSYSEPNAFDDPWSSETTKPSNGSSNGSDNRNSNNSGQNGTSFDNPW